MSVAAVVIEVVEGAIALALKASQLAGLPLPGAHEVQALIDKVNAQVARTLPAQLEAMSVAVAAAGLLIDRDLGKLPPVERCPHCNSILAISIDSSGHRTRHCATHGAIA